MKIKPECALCITRQVVDVAKEITDDKSEQFKIISWGIEKISEAYGESSVPSFMGTEIHRYIKEMTKNNDPYKNLKNVANEFALKYLKDVEKLLESNDELERLQNKVKLSIAGNVIDFGPYSTGVDVEKMVKDTLDGKLDIDFSNELLNDLKNSKKIFYTCDNAGEIVFDLPLIKELKNYVEVVVSVKGSPILNDATLEDVKTAGIDKITRVITSGTDAIGIRFEESSKEFIDEFNSCDFVIAKGMGNYESLTEYEEKHGKSEKIPVYYILKAKCEPVAEHIGVHEGDNVLLRKEISKV
ncbi:damage-control phosphatase ARMT1 family protein [Methanococcus sp. CF]